MPWYTDDDGEKVVVPQTTSDDVANQISQIQYDEDVSPDTAADVNSGMDMAVETIQTFVEPEGGGWV